MPYALILLTSIICKLATEIVIFIMHIWRPAAEGRGPESQLPSQTTSTNTVRSYTLNHDFSFFVKNQKT